MSLVAATVRWLTVSLGVGADYAGDVLGDDQWEWLQGVSLCRCVCVWGVRVSVCVCVCVCGVCD
jgi:hypothetical protein